MSGGISGISGIYWGFCVRINRVLLRVILPQISQITQRNAAWLHYFAEKDRLVRLMQFCVGQRKSARSAGDIVVSVCGLIEYSCVLFSRRSRRSRRGMQRGCIISQRKTVWDGGEVNVVLLFVCVNLRD